MDRSTYFRRNHPYLAQVARAYPVLGTEHVACACCGSRTSVDAFHDDRYGFHLTTVVCAKCGLLFTNPRPDKEWFRDFYAHGYRVLYESSVRPEESYLRSDWVTLRHTRNIEWLNSCRRIGLLGRLIDVGCAEGSFLNAFRSMYPGWTLCGVEPSISYSEFARSDFGLPRIITDPVESLSGRAFDYRFDILMMNHVLEHMEDPNVFFMVARQILVDGGIIFFDVPDVEGASRGIGNVHIAHLYHFSAQTLANFCRKHGFRVVARRKGVESPQWTFQMIARKEASVPEAFRVDPVDARAVARAFAAYAGKLSLPQKVARGVRAVARHVLPHP